MDEVLMLKEVPDRYRQFSEYSLRRDVKAKRIKHFRVGNRIYFRVSDLEDYVNQLVEESVKPTEAEVPEVFIPARLRRAK
jgi:hypothetical protein